MKFWTDLKVRIKIMVLVLLGCAGLAIVSGLGYYVLTQAHESIGELKDGMEHVVTLQDMKSDFLAMRLDLVYLLSLSDRDKIEEKVKDYQQHISSVKSGIEKNQKLDLEPKEKELLATFVKGFEAYLGKGQVLGDMAQQAAREGRTDRTEIVQFAVGTVAPLYTGPAAAIGELVKLNVADADAMYDADTDYGKKLKFSLVIVFGITTVLSLLAGTLISKSINTPLQDVIGVMLKVAAGDLTVRTRISSHDELGVLGGEVNHMADRLATTMKTVAENSVRVSTAATLLHGTAEQIATGAEEVASQTGTVATASEEMAATSSDIARNCLDAAETSNRASETARNGADIVQEALRGMEQIAGKVREAARSVTSLGTRSDQIGAIVGTIEDIADQTNLLALNAAIEAARAGEQGRGFAVVADEVRALAERTTRATREIGEMIKAIQGETKGAVRAMEDGVNEVERGTQASRKSGEALELILNQIQEVTMQVNQIATAAEEQTATTGEITTNIQQITEVVQSTARGAHDTATASADLSQQAEVLQQLVRQFKL